MRRTSPAVGQRTQHVVDGLRGDVAEIRADDADDRVGVGVRMVVDRGQHRHPRTGDPQASAAQQVLGFRRRWARPESGPIFWNESENRVSARQVAPPP